jgi:hypothetical protein
MLFISPDICATLRARLSQLKSNYNDNCCFFLVSDGKYQIDI